MTYAVVFDIECTADGPAKFKADWNYPANYMLTAAFLLVNLVNGDERWHNDLEELREDVGGFDNVKFIVGHNIKFDMHWLQRYNTYHLPSAFSKAVWWDTMLAQHLINGSDKTKRLNLDTVADFWFSGVKLSTLGDALEAGKKVQDIPMDDLIKYCQQDVRITKDVFLKQLKHASKQCILPHLISQMEGLACTWEIEHNGMAFDVDEARKAAEELYEQRNVLGGTLANIFLDVTGAPEDYKFNPNSVHDVRCVLYGSPVSYTAEAHVYDEDGLPVRYKSGPRKGCYKTRKEKRIFKPDYDVEGTETGEEALNAYMTADPKKHAFIHHLLQYRDVDKQISTYYNGYSEMVVDGKLHPRINVTATPTGRYSMSNPNLQNVTRKRDD